MRKRICVQTVDILEWYDGWMAAVVETDSGWYLGCVVAANPDEHRRRYALVAITQEIASEIRSIFANNGFSEELNRKWFEAISLALEVRVLWQEARPRAVLMSELATFSERKRLMRYRLPLVDKAMSREALSFWF